MAATIRAVKIDGDRILRFAEFSSKTEAETILAQLSDKVSAFVAQGRNVSPLKETLAEYQSASHRPI